jgi:hypothetical protein
MNIGNARKHPWKLARAVVFMLCAVGCSKEYVDTPSAPSPDGRRSLSMRSENTLLRPYEKRNAKKISVSVGSGQQSLFQRHYNLVGSDIKWHTHWVSNDEVQINLYDHAATGDASNHIKTLSLCLNRVTGKFEEKK